MVKFIHPRKNYGWTHRFGVRLPGGGPRRNRDGSEGSVPDPVVRVLRRCERHKISTCERSVARCARRQFWADRRVLPRVLAPVPIPDRTRRGRELSDAGHRRNTPALGVVQRRRGTQPGAEGSAGEWRESELRDEGIGGNGRFHARLPHEGRDTAAPGRGVLRRRMDGATLFTCRG